MLLLSLATIESCVCCHSYAQSYWVEGGYVGNPPPTGLRAIGINERADAVVDRGKETLKLLLHSH